MQLHRAFHRGLGMELGGIGQLEQDMLHDVTAQGLGQHDRLALEQHIAKTPLGRSECRGQAHLALHHHHRQAYRARGGIARRPGLARAGIGRMTIGAQCGTVDPGMGQGIDDLLTAAAQQFGDHRGGRHPDQKYMIKAHAIETVLQRQHALNLVGHDHGVQHVLHGQRRLAVGEAHAAQVIRHCQDAAQVVGGMAPLGGQPGVVEIQPAHDAADVPGRLHRVQFMGGAGHARAVAHRGALHQWTEMLGAFGKAQGQQAAAQGIHQAITCGGVGLVGIALVIAHIVGDIHQQLIGLRTFTDIEIVTHHVSLCCIDRNRRRLDASPGLTVYSRVSIGTQVADSGPM